MRCCHTVACGQLGTDLVNLAILGKITKSRFPFPRFPPLCNTFSKWTKKSVKQIIICSKLLRRRHCQFFNMEIIFQDPKFFPLKTLTWFMITCHFPNLDKGENTIHLWPYHHLHGRVRGRFAAAQSSAAVRHLSGYGFLSRTSWSGAQPLSQSRWVSQGVSVLEKFGKISQYLSRLSRMEDVQKWDGFWSGWIPMVMLGSMDYWKPPKINGIYYGWNLLWHPGFWKTLG